MTSSSIRRSLATACALVTSVMLLACGSDPTPPRPRGRDGADVAGRDVEVADAGADGTTLMLDSGTAGDDDAVTWDEVAPTLVRIAGRDVEVVEGGAGSATVVFESGLGNDWTSWDEVAREVSARARVFAYSRPGYGASDPTTAPRDASRIVEDLRALLAARDLPPPYVLVGHSFGGAYMELFAKAHAPEVAGLVLVETRHGDFAAACQADGLDGCVIPDSVVITLPQVEQAEIEAFARTADQIRAAGRFGTYPVRVLTATAHGFVPEVEALWASLHGSLADEAAHGEQLVFDGASHLLHVERPHDVATVILSLVSAR